MRNGRVIRFVTEQSGAAAIVAATFLPVLVLASAMAVEIAMVVDYRQRLASAAELTCRQSTLYLNQQSGRPNRNTAAEVETIRNMADANMKMLGLDAESWPLGITVENGRARIILEGQARQVMFNLDSVPAIAPRVTLNCSDIPEAPNLGQASTTLLQQDFETTHRVPANSVEKFLSFDGWISGEAGFEIAGERSSFGAAGLNRYYVRLDMGSNSAIETTVELDNADYELAYLYKSESTLPGYGQQTICGSAASVAWATEMDQTYRIEASLAPGLAEPTILDVCVYAANWVERRVKFRANGGTYRLAFAAAGRADSIGGLLDNIRLCEDTCP